MGNLFMGFPVPRAKIAEMIEGTAPPTLHIVNHLPDGSDPIVIPEDIDADQLLQWDGAKFIGTDEPTPGMTFPWDDYVFQTHFESLDGFDTFTQDGGTIALTHEKVLFTTTGTSYSQAYLRKLPTHPPITLTWDKPRKFSTSVRFKLDAGVTGTYYVTIGNPFSTNAIGFRVDNGVFRATSKDVTGNEMYTIEDWSLDPGTYNRHLAVDYDPPNYPRFYVDGILVYTADTRKPTGITNAPRILYFNVGNPTNGHAQELSFSEFMFWQGA